LNIYLISQWYYPEPDGRVSALAEALAAEGHEVVVVTAFPNYPQGKIYEGYRVKWRQWEEINGVRVLRLPIFPDHSRSTIKRILNYASFSLSLFFLAPWFIKKPSVFWAYTPFVILPTLWLKALFKAPYVLEITDVWPDTIYATGMLKRGMLTKLLNGIAHMGYKHASAITVQNIGFKTRLMERDVEEEKLFVVENWADEEIFRPIDYDIDLAKKHNLQDKFIVMFAGNMGIAQGLDNIIESAKLCKDITDVHYVFVGDGACLQAIKQQVIKDSELNNVSFIDRKPLNEMASYFSLANVLLVTLRDDPLFEITLPSKTQAYLACGKPIIIVKRGEDAKMLNEKGCALNCEPDNPEALADTVKQMFDMSLDERMRMGKCSLELYKERYRKKILVKIMENILLNAA
jgi:putative colanic acid biosynthesis glycosyltransferase WcaI